MPSHSVSIKAHLRGIKPLIFPAPFFSHDNTIAPSIFTSFLISATKKKLRRTEGERSKKEEKKSPCALQLLPKDTLHQVIIHHSDSPPSSDETQSSAGAPPPPPLLLLPALLPKILEHGPTWLPYLPRCDYILSVNPRYKGRCGSLHSLQLGILSVRFWLYKKTEKNKTKHLFLIRKTFFISNSGSLEMGIKIPLHLGTGSDVLDLVASIVFNAQ